MNCEYCGAKMIPSKRTGKLYCSAKCWLKNQPQQSGQSDDVMGALRKLYEKLNEIESLCNTINYKISKEEIAVKKQMPDYETNDTGKQDWYVPEEEEQP